MSLIERLVDWLVDWSIDWLIDQKFKRQIMNQLIKKKTSIMIKLSGERMCVLVIAFAERCADIDLNQDGPGNVYLYWLMVELLCG